MNILKQLIIPILIFIAALFFYFRNSSTDDKTPLILVIVTAIYLVVRYIGVKRRMDRNNQNKN